MRHKKKGRRSFAGHRKRGRGARNRKTGTGTRLSPNLNRKCNNSLTDAEEEKDP